MRWPTAPPSPHLDRYALATAVRAAIVVPGVLAFALEVLDAPRVAPLAFFGAVALLLFTDFGGPPRTRLLAYGAVAVAGAGLVVLGTLCAARPLLAAAAMAVVGFGVLFAGVLNSYVAAGSRAAILAFVLPAMLVAQASLAQRLAGWLLGCTAALLALALPWPRRPPDRLRAAVVAATRALADAVTASGRVGAEALARLREETGAAVRAMQRAFLATPTRPTGTAAGQTALGQLVEDVVWLDAMPLPPARGAPEARFPETDEAVRAAVAGVLDAAAGLLAGDDGPPPDLDGLVRVRDDVAARFRRAADSWRRGEPEPLAADLEEAYRLRTLAGAAGQLGGDALRAAGRTPPAELPPFGSRPGTVRGLAAAHATMRSVWLRNSLRSALGLSIAVLVGQLADVQHAFWVVLGTLAVLRSQAVTTGKTLVQELAGTVAGIVAGGLLVHLVGTDTALLWTLLGPVALLAAYARRAVSFPAGQAVFSFQLLIVFNLIAPAGWQIGLVRVEDVAIGAGISLVVALLLWPRGASGVLREHLADAFERSAAQVAAAAAAVDADDAPGEPARAAAASWQRLDATLRQYLSERPREISFEHLSVLVAGVTRLQRTAQQLEAGRAMVRSAPVAHPSAALRAERTALACERDELRRWYAALADALRRARRPPEATRAEPQASPAPAPADRAADVPERLAVAWTRAHLTSLLALEPRIAAAAGALARASG